MDFRLLNEWPSVCQTGIRSYIRSYVICLATGNLFITIFVYPLNCRLIKEMYRRTYMDGWLYMHWAPSYCTFTSPFALDFCPYNQRQTCKFFIDEMNKVLFSCRVLLCLVLVHKHLLFQKLCLRPEVKEGTDRPTVVVHGFGKFNPDRCGLIRGKSFPVRFSFGCTRSE